MIRPDPHGLYYIRSDLTRPDPCYFEYLPIRLDPRYKKKILAGLVMTLSKRSSFLTKTRNEYTPAVRTTSS